MRIKILSSLHRTRWIHLQNKFSLRSNATAKYISAIQHRSVESVQRYSASKVIGKRWMDFSCCSTKCGNLINHRSDFAGKYAGRILIRRDLKFVSNNKSPCWRFQTQEMLADMGGDFMTVSIVFWRMTVRRCCPPFSFSLGVELTIISGLSDCWIFHACAHHHSVYPDIVVYGWIYRCFWLLLRWWRELWMKHWIPHNQICLKLRY